ncbi:MAG: glucose-6-phosphate isomerase [Deltaproteobacteria bacterium]|nr:glucose-6-phosphate isomerase [Deltaproteobacteria bacterium]
MSEKESVREKSGHEESVRAPVGDFPFSLDVRFESGGGFQWTALWEALDRLLDDRDGPAAFLGLPDDHDALESVLGAVGRVPDGFRRVLVLGIGGSGLGARAGLEALAPLETRGRAREVRVLSNVDPSSVADALDWFDPADTLLSVVSKSGGTIETLSQFALFADRILAFGGAKALADGVTIITDPESGPLRAMASSAGCATLDVPPLVGGRFSVLTPVGLFPLAMAGHDIARILEGARRVIDGVKGPDRSMQPTIRSAVHHIGLMHQGVSVRVLWAYCDRLASFGDWFCQLWAESLGKVGESGRVGQTPLRAVGSTDQHSLLQLFMEGPREHCLTFLRVGGPWPHLEVPDMTALAPALGEFAGKDLKDVLDALGKGTMAALLEEQLPLVDMQVPDLDEESLGALFMHFEVETALIGYVLGIDPFDQPGVETGKLFAHGLMGRTGSEDYGRQAMRLLGGRG